MTYRLALLAQTLAVAVLMTAGLPTLGHGAEVIDVRGTQIALEVGKGQLVRLDHAASSVFVADPSIADVQVKSGRLIYVFAKKPGETVLFAADKDDSILLSRKVSVQHNLSRLRESLRDLLPKANIDVRTVDGSLVLSGTANNATEVEDARKLALRMVEKAEQDRVVIKIGVTGPNQVQLRVRVAEVSRSVLKELGVNWDAAFNSGNVLLGLATGNPVLAGSALLTRTGDTNSAFGSYRSGKLDINGLLDALDDQGMVTILAEPNLTAVTGETAKFLAGGEFPILVPQGDGQIAVEYKQFGVSLAFAPTILGETRTSLDISTEVSQLSNNAAVQIQGFNIPSLTTRRTNTTVEMGSGQSFAIAGLLQNNVTQDLSKFPGLGDLPILGPLFRSNRFRSEESELVIIVTPYLVRPVMTSQLAAPTDGLTPPSDTDRVWRGQTHRPRLETGGTAPQDSGGLQLIGPVGFTLEQ